MPIVILHTTVENRSPIPGLGRGFSRLQKQALQETARYWHANLLRPHFGPANRSRYRHDPREPFYLQEIKRKTGTGQGRYVDDVLTGRSQRFLLVFATVSGTSKQSTVTMKPPAYFTNPFEGTFFDQRTKKLKRVSGQPDKPREVTTVDERDRRELATFHAQRLEQLVAQATQHTHKRLD